MSIYYFENENGTFFSEDEKRRFIRLSGKDAYDYMRENKTGDSYFVQTVTNDTEDGEKVFANSGTVTLFRRSRTTRRTAKRSLLRCRNRRSAFIAAVPTTRSIFPK